MQTRKSSPTVAAGHDNATLREATPADWEQLVALDQLIFGSYGAEEDPAIIKARLETFPHGCMVLEENQDLPNGATIHQLLGYLTTEKWSSVREPRLDEDPRQSHQPTGTILNITTLAISPTHQNRRLGVRLVEAAIAIARRESCTDIVLETAHAERFYERHHFKKIGERTERNIPLHIMRYRLSDN